MSLTQPTGFVAAPPAARTNVLAIVAIITGFMAPIAGIITGHMALRQIARTGEEGRAAGQQEADRWHPDRPNRRSDRATDFAAA
ncbi:DUF4190 domain-containing protein [Agromyces sp. NPDC049794]|uniref:DUF4190 domain-containing protein n=1 Tax=unclassified Agromyces TaxID=2639701 RepID=UPI0033DAA764